MVGGPKVRMDHFFSDVLSPEQQKARKWAQANGVAALMCWSNKNTSTGRFITKLGPWRTHDVLVLGKRPLSASAAEATGIERHLLSGKPVIQRNSPVQSIDLALQGDSYQKVLNFISSYVTPDWFQKEGKKGTWATISGIQLRSIPSSQALISPTIVRKLRWYFRVRLIGGGGANPKFAREHRGKEWASSSSLYVYKQTI